MKLIELNPIAIKLGIKVFELESLFAKSVNNNYPAYIYYNYKIL